MVDLAVESVTKASIQTHILITPLGSARRSSRVRLTGVTTDQPHTHTPIKNGNTQVVRDVNGYKECDVKRYVRVEKARRGDIYLYI